MQHPKTWKNSLRSYRPQLRRGTRGFTLQIGKLALTKAPGKLTLDREQIRYWKDGPLGHYWTGETTSTASSSNVNVAYYNFVQSYRQRLFQVTWR